ncbi:metal ABC transporter solute-binding protein, Zn/Mn family [Anabaena subtropica]|uniref:Zinc ABC transporter substrate-binding protein n=1 Tax=Anabaena subtropica FACHB-260 TaxID=2692884 RepID=A0ABR8CMC0_9NOST|nr:zinc ABC transporter substrate-binding protein [Anabaena subtropica]MBD2344387.1 zinc ABC transporter substrate-binding protein [Anabaena subtropica FACHB-260]
MSKNLLANNSLRVILLLFTSGFVACRNQITSTSLTQTANVVDENLPKVVATTSVLCDLTRQIAENTINLICLIPPNQVPQAYQPTTEDSSAIEQANLIFYNGYNLEPELIKLINATKNSAPKIAVSQIAVPQPQKFPENSRQVSNPYVWHNPKNAIKIVEVINSSLKKLEPNNATIYSDNTIRIKSELTQLDNWIKLKIATIPQDKRRLVTNYNAIDYYTKAYGVPSATIGTEAQATDQRVKNLTAYVQKSNVLTIFADMTDTSRLMESVATEAEVKLSERQLYTQGLGEPTSDGDTYQNMMVANTRTIVEGLGGTYLIFQPKAQK